MRTQLNSKFHYCVHRSLTQQLEHAKNLILDSDRDDHAAVDGSCYKTFSSYSTLAK
jgi:hypothetical protein